MVELEFERLQNLLEWSDTRVEPLMNPGRIVLSLVNILLICVSDGIELDSDTCS